MSAVASRLRRSWAYTCGIFSFTPRGTPLALHQPLHQIRELQKVRQTDHGTVVADRHPRTGRRLVGPVHWHGADCLLVDLQQESRAVPVIPTPDANELPAAERMEWVRHAHKMRRCARRGRILC